jgi:hypothetical protein
MLGGEAAALGFEIGAHVGVQLIALESEIIVGVHYSLLTGALWRAQASLVNPVPIALRIVSTTGECEHSQQKKNLFHK